MQLLQLLLALVPYAVAGLIGLALPLVAVLAYGRLQAGLVLMLAAMLADVLLLSAPILRVGITLYVADVPMVLLAIVAAWRWLARADMPRRHGAWLLLLAVFGIGLAIGLARHGTAAGVAARADFYALAAASYAMSFPLARNDLRALWRLLTWGALLLLGLCLYRWLVIYLPIRELLPYGGIYNNDGEIRVIWASGALLMAEVALLGVFFGGAGSGLHLARWGAAPLLAAVLVLQHRSVWLAALVGALVALLMAGRQRASRLAQGLLLVALVMASLLPVVLSERLAGQFGQSVQSALAGEGTVHARLENWRVTLRTWAGHGPLALAIGDEPGSDRARVVETERGEQRRISYSAHNHYVSLLTGTGIVGLLAYLWMSLRVLRGLLLTPETSAPLDAPMAAPTDAAVDVQGAQDALADTSLSAALLVLMAMQWAYNMSYGADMLQFALLGVALAWVSAPPRRRLARGGLRRGAGPGSPGGRAMGPAAPPASSGPPASPAGAVNAPARPAVRGSA